MRKFCIYFAVTALPIATLLTTCASFSQNYDASTGPPMNVTSKTGAGPQGMGGLGTQKTGKQNKCDLPCGMEALSMPFGNNGLAGLPPCNLDSLVKMNEEVFGDEGIGEIPPYFEFGEEHRLARTVVDPNPYLTTFHGSVLPSAFGKDEFIGGPEMSLSGPGF